MNALTQPAGTIAAASTAPLLRTLVLCDLVDSTALVERLGDQRGADLLRKHDRVFRALLPKHGGREIDKTDGFLAMFDRPIQAVAFALDYQRGLQQLNQNEKSTLAARVGIHVGDVLTWDNTPDDIAKGAKLTEVEGLVKPITSRLMQLALPGQTLLSGVAYSLAHRAQGELGELLSTVRWRTYGRYRFKGIPDPIPVFEVGEDGRAPLRAPPWSGKAHREVPFWRRPATVAIETVLLLVLVGAPLWYLLRTPPAIAFANRDWVVVGDMKNLTGQANLDESVQTAFRIGLEQSRYVNVMSDLKTRETIKLMQRDPDKTAIDRATGSEVAIRDGARALILPTVAEIGGRVRVTAEVVDPQTQTTVYSESADGIGEDSVLPSLDRVNQKLRVRLGEALATVSNESKPLDKVATKNLEALKAYSLAVRSYAQGHMSEARALYTQALQADSEFALAHVGLAKISISLDQSADAERELGRAINFSSRLSSREKLYVEVWLATYTNPRLALEKWKLLTSLYSGNFDGQYGFVLWQSANRFSDAISSVQKALAPQNPYRGASQQLLGTLLLGANRYDDSIKEFSESLSSGVTTQNEYYAMAHAAKREFSVADKLLASGKPFDLQARDFGGDITRIAIALDQGHWRQAQAIIDHARSLVSVDDTENVALFDGVDLSVRSIVDKNDSAMRERLANFTRTGAKSHDGNDDAFFRAALGSYIAAHVGDVELARTTLAALGSMASQPRVSPMSANMHTVAEAELMRVTGQVADAAGKLKSIIDGNELYITHVALADALVDRGDTAGAIAETRWMAENRGRAFAEYNSRTLLTPYNIAQADLSLLRRAELSAASGNRAQANEALAAFQKAWPDTSETSEIARRVEKVGSKP
jgi:putative peptide modification system cyclase